MSSLAGALVASACDVSKSYGQGPLAITVLHACSCEIFAGQLTLLVGPSGSGKTTLISMLGGLLKPSSGSVTLCGTNVSECDEEEAARIRRRNLGFVFQNYKLFPALTALQNVSEILRMKGAAAKDAGARAAAALQAVGLGHRLHYRPGELSGGQKQRVAIARAIASEPRLVIGDEVTAALDTETSIAVVEMLAAYANRGAGVLLVTHDLRLERWAHRVLHMNDGRIESIMAGGAAHAESRTG